MIRTYMLTSPYWLRTLHPGRTWSVDTEEKEIYLTFDDGPTPEITQWVLDKLARFEARATFFCIGKNAAAHPQLTQSIVDAGHSLGNHTHNHLNGFKSDRGAYLENIELAGQHIPSKLFRPPYGRMTRQLAREVAKTHKIIMWSVLSGDFDTKISGEKVAQNCIKHIEPGSIVVFHDSAKAWPRLRIALPEVLNHFSEMGYRFEAL